jgi:hypothetical protein
MMHDAATGRRGCCSRSSAITTQKKTQNLENENELSALTAFSPLLA